MAKKVKKGAEKIIQQSMRELGLRNDMVTNPTIIKNIIEEFKLDDFKTKNKRMDKFFKDIVSVPQKLKPMLDDIEKGIVEKHPAIIEFAELALEKKWFHQSEYIIRSIHATYIIEALTAAMCNSHDFFVEIHNHYKKKELERGINSLHTLKSIIRAIFVSHSIFGAIKSFSVDPAMIYFRTQRGFCDSRLKEKEAKKLLKTRKINYLEYKLLSPLHKKGLEQINELIRMNIYEAGITEFKKGLKTNSICAHELSEDIKHNPPKTLFKNKCVAPENSKNDFYSSISEKRNLFPAIEFSQDWVSLYITWNMAFTLNETEDLDIVLPKLFIPSIINAKSEDFLGARIISLWLTVNHVFFRKCDRKIVTGPKNKTEMARAWAKINKKYAFDLAKRETHEESKILMKSYKRFYSQPVYNLFKILGVIVS
jgi:hypothetical protein